MDEWLGSGLKGRIYGYLGGRMEGYLERCMDEYLT